MRGGIARGQEAALERQPGRGGRLLCSWWTKRGNMGESWMSHDAQSEAARRPSRCAHRPPCPGHPSPSATTHPGAAADELGGRGRKHDWLGSVSCEGGFTYDVCGVSGRRCIDTIRGGSTRRRRAPPRCLHEDMRVHACSSATRPLPRGKRRSEQGSARDVCGNLKIHAQAAGALLVRLGPSHANLGRLSTRLWPLAPSKLKAPPRFRAREVGAKDTKATWPRAHC